MIDKSQQNASGIDLDSPLDRYLRNLFAELLATTARVLRDDDLSLPQLATLHMIESRGSMRIGELAGELLQPMPATSRFVSDLVERGLLLRKEDAADRRAKVLSLTAKGQALVTAMNRQRLEESTAAMLKLNEGVGAKYIEFYQQMLSTNAVKAEDE